MLINALLGSNLQVVFLRMHIEVHRPDFDWVKWIGYENWVIRGDNDSANSRLMAF